MARSGGSAAPAIPTGRAPATPRPARRLQPTHTPHESCEVLSRWCCGSSSCDLLRLAQAFDQGAAQEKGAGALGILGGAPQFVVIALAHGGIVFRQQPLVVDGLRLRVGKRDVTTLALVAVELALLRLAAQNAHELVGEIEGVVDAAVHAHGADRTVHMGGVA